MSCEAVVSSFAERLGDLLIEEAPLLYGVRDSVEWIRRELKSKQSFLKDAESKQKEDARVKNLVAEIREVCYDAEDVIDAFIDSQRAKKGDGFAGRVKRLRSMFPSEIITRHKLGEQIEEIKHRISDISRRDDYGMRDIYLAEASSSSRRLPEHRRSSALLQESEVVGLQDEIKTLTEQLVNGEVRRCVISIVGMGGLGKTALAQKVYHDVKKDFECHAFIYLSQEYVLKDVLMRIIECVMSLSPEEKERLDEVGLKKKLHDYLKEKRYLVVLDNIWSIEAWDYLNPILPNTGQSKSVVMLTTRTRDVAVQADPLTSLHEMRPLNDYEGWELFRKRVFLGKNSSAACRSELEELEETGRKILKNCGGLPLAILVVGGILSTRDANLVAWHKVLESVTGDLYGSLLRILALSYWDLPYYLKPCFLYLGIFPEDSEIGSGRLIRLWIAEGFIEQRGDQIMEDVAEEYLEELVHRSMIQVINRKSNGSIRKCRIHNILRDFSISEATQNNFFAIHNDNDTRSSSTGVRRLVLYWVDGYKTTNRLTATHLRSIFCFPGSKVRLSQLLNVGGKLLRVLVAEGAEINKEQVEAFIHLRYLELARISLPSSIGNLSDLQTLKLSFHGTLPNAIWNLEQLRHLSCSGFNTNEHPKLKKLRNLQTLKLSAGSWIGDGLGKLSNLRKLGIRGDLSSHHKALSDSIDKLSNLQSLKLDEGHSIPPFESFSRHSALYKMYWDGRIEKLPMLPQAVVELTLKNSLLRPDAISMLGELPRLKILRLLHKSYDGERMICSQGGFPCLELLKLCELPLECLIVEEGAMMSLKSVELFDVSKLQTEPLPKRVHSILKQI